MIERVKYIGHLKRFSTRLNLIIKKIEKNNSEIDDQDRAIIKTLTENFLKQERD